MVASVDQTLRYMMSWSKAMREAPPAVNAARTTAGVGSPAIWVSAPTSKAMSTAMSIKSAVRVVIREDRRMAGTFRLEFLSGGVELAEAKDSRCSFYRLDTCNQIRTHPHLSNHLASSCLGNKCHSPLVLPSNTTRLTPDMGSFRALAHITGPTHTDLRD